MKNIQHFIEPQRLKLTIMIIPPIERIANRIAPINISEKLIVVEGEKIVTKEINKTATVAITSRIAINQANCLTNKKIKYLIYIN
jgi:hypothetical protein